MNLKRHSIALPLCMAAVLLLTPKLLFAETNSEASSAQVSAPGSGETGVQSETRKDDNLVKHKAQPLIKRGERLLVRAKLNTKDGVHLARVYFKSDRGNQYNFVVLNESKRNIYEAELPAVGNDIEAVEYKIVFKDGLGEVYKTDKYSVAVAAGAASTVALSGFVDVFSEYPEDKSENMGFSDVVRYSYGAGELVTQSGYAASVSSPGAGYVGATGSATGSVSSGVASSAAGSSLAGSSAAAASASSAALATTAVSGGSAAAATGTVIAVTGGAVAAVAVVAVVADDDSASSSEGDCFSGIVKYTTTESEVSVTRWVEFRSGVPYGESISNSVTACQEDVTGVNVQFSAEDKAAYQANCITQAQIEEVYDELGLDANSSYEFVNAHGCGTIFQY